MTTRYDTRKFTLAWKSPRSIVRNLSIVALMLARLGNWSQAFLLWMAGAGLAVAGGGPIDPDDSPPALNKLLSASHAESDSSEQRPNIILIVADDLGYGDLGCYGQQVIQTPRLDQMAAEGMRFTQYYAGCTVCAPSRSVMMTGQHTGHTWVRGNAGVNDTRIQSLRDEDITVAEIAKDAGYRTALIGKWGLGEIGQPGFPLDQGFDSFFGYTSQLHAHNYYPEYLWRDREQVKLRNVVARPPGKSADFLGGTATTKVDYSHDLLIDEALRFIENNAADSFFLYLALTIPHANNEATRMVGNGAEVPTYGAYGHEDWPEPDKGQAAMITRMDGDIGRILDQLRELDIDQNTVVFFTSDNGPHDEANHNLERFKPSGPFRGIKRSLLEGGLRVPFIAWWPEHIAPAKSDLLCYGADVLPTLQELMADSGLKPDVDGISVLPTLLGNAQQRQHEFLYWEFHEQGSRQSVRFGDWVAIREPMLHGDVRLYDVSQDPGELHDRAAEMPEVVLNGTSFMDRAHVPSENWKVQGEL